MQMKAFICMLGILLLVILLAGKLVLLLIQKGDEDEVPVPTPKPHIPVVQLLTNVWIMEADAEGLMIFRDGQSERYPWGAQAAEETFGTEEAEGGTVVGEGGAAGEGINGSQASDGAAGENGSAGLPDFSVREQVADVELTDGTVTSVEVKQEKINGKILGADEAGIEVEGYGKLPLAADYRGIPSL